MITATDMATARALPRLGDAISTVARATRVRLVGTATRARRRRR